MLLSMVGIEDDHDRALKITNSPKYVVRCRRPQDVIVPRMPRSIGDILDINGDDPIVPNQLADTGEEECASSASSSALYYEVWSDFVENLLIDPDIQRKLLRRDSKPVCVVAPHQRVEVMHMKPLHNVPASHQLPPGPT